jgi:hypothetical protein
MIANRRGTIPLPLPRLRLADQAWATARVEEWLATQRERAAS